MTTKQCFREIADIIFRLRKIGRARKIPDRMRIDLIVDPWLRDAVYECRPEIEAWADCRVVHIWSEPGATHIEVRKPEVFR
jgi:hypothetical protein